MSPQQALDGWWRELHAAADELARAYRARRGRTGTRHTQAEISAWERHIDALRAAQAHAAYRAHLAALQAQPQAAPAAARQVVGEDVLATPGTVIDLATHRGHV